MGNAQALEKHQTSSGRDEVANAGDVKDFETRWKSFMNSLDVSAEHIKQIELLDENKKTELLFNYESKNPRRSAFHYVTLLKGSRIEYIWKKKVDCSAFRSLLSSVEISLRTNNVEWVYDFLDYEGLETLADLMLQCLHFLSDQDASFGQRKYCGSKASTETYRARYEISCSAEIPNYIRSNSMKSTQSCSSNLGSGVMPMLILHNGGSLKGCSLTPTFLEFLKDSLHLCLRCLKAILNNQKGCKRAMENPLVISLLTFCLLHPNYSTKTLALDILTALCLIEGGHVKVLQSFDRLRVVMGEGLRFELLLAAFRYHESLDEENYNMDFAVTCVQFLNIVVHSPENINLRVYLQYELHLLGFDDLLKQIRDRSGSRLKVQIEAYLDNRVDCSLLLEDAEAKEAAISEQERLEKELKLEISTSKKLEANFKHKETELLQIIESLRVKKHELEIFSANHESAMRKQITELRIMLQSAQLEINELKQNLHIVQTTTATIKSFNSMSTSTNFETYKIAKSNNNHNNNSNNNNNLVNLSKVNNIETSPSTEPTMVTRSISVEENFSNNHNDNDSSHHERQQSHHHRPSPSGSEASLDNSHNTTTTTTNNNNHHQQKIKPNNSNHVTHMYQMDSNSSNNYNQSNHYHDQPPVKPQRKGLDQKSNNLFSPCTPQNLTSSKHLANQATSYLSELFKLVSNLAQNSKISRSANIHEDVYKKNSITIYPIGWKFSYYPVDVTIYDDDNSMKRETVETIFNDHIFRTCYLANISMKAEGICTNSQDFFTIYSNQLPEIWLNALNKYKYSQNFFNENDTSSNSLHLNHTVRSKLVSDLHHLGLLSAVNNETKQIDNNIHMNNYENDNHDNDNDDDDDNIVNESKILKSKLIQYLLYINLNPLITQRILNELHYTLQHLSIINNNNNNDKINTNFIVMNSLTIELFNTMDKVLKKYFNKLNIKLPTILFNNDEDDNYESNNELHRWSYIQAILQINLIKFTIIEELKIINEHLSLILECCTSLLVSTKLPLIMQLIWQCTSMLLNDSKSCGFQLKSLDSLIDWQLNLPEMSNNSSELQSQDSMTTIIKVNENIKYTKTSFLLAFVMYISKIAPNLLNWPSELNQLEIVSRISISNLFKRIEYIKSTLDFLLNYSKTTENVNSSITNSTTNIHEHNKATIILGNLSLDDKLVMEHLSELLTKTSDIIWIIIHSTAYWIMTFQSTVSSSCPSNNIIVSDEWLNPLVRFTTSFKNCINELDKKSYHSQNSLGLSESYSSRSSHSHRHSQRCSKDQEKAPSSSKHENRHRKPRTRQLDTDGLMDDILHNLTLNPLRTDIHVRRLDKVD